MLTEKQTAPMSLSFELSYEQIQKAHEIYQQHCFTYDFLNRCSDRMQEETGLCNLPYKTLPDEDGLLRTAYEIYLKKEDCNTAYNDTLDAVIDEIEQQIADITLINNSSEDLEVA